MSFLPMIIIFSAGFAMGYGLVCLLSYIFGVNT